VGQSPLVGGVAIGSGGNAAATSSSSTSYFLSVGGNEGNGDSNAFTTSSDINDAELEAIVNQGGAAAADSAAATTSQSQMSKGSTPHDERRSLLKEVREHLDLLKEFEGVIAPEELNKRKRELFIALPPAPPPAKLRKSTGETGVDTV